MGAVEYKVGDQAVMYDPGVTPTATIVCKVCKVTSTTVHVVKQKEGVNFWSYIFSRKTGRRWGLKRSLCRLLPIPDERVVRALTAKLRRKVVLAAECCDEGAKLVDAFAILQGELTSTTLHVVGEDQVIHEARGCDEAERLRGALALLKGDTLP